MDVEELLNRLKNDNEGIARNIIVGSIYKDIETAISTIKDLQGKITMYAELCDDMHKTIEGLPHWHDLRKYPEDLPPHNTLVLVVIGRFYDIAWLDSYDNFRLSRNNNIVSITEWCEISKKSAE